nr:hypothetical protein CFP56_22243 [Quercus suber]
MRSPRLSVGTSSPIATGDFAPGSNIRTTGCSTTRSFANKAANADTISAGNCLENDAFAKLALQISVFLGHVPRTQCWKSQASTMASSTILLPPPMRGGHRLPYHFSCGHGKCRSKVTMSIYPEISEWPLRVPFRVQVVSKREVRVGVTGIQFRSVTVVGRYNARYALESKACGFEVLVRGSVTWSRAAGAHEESHCLASLELMVVVRRQYPDRAADLPP